MNQAIDVYGLNHVTVDSGVMNTRLPTSQPAPNTDFPT